MTQSLSAQALTGRFTSLVALVWLGGVTVDIQWGTLPPLVGVIAAESGLSGSEIGWVFNSMMVGSAISVGLTARMGDIYGHRKVLIALSFLALLGCAVAATGDGFWPLVAGRFLLGFAVTLPLSWGLLRPRATARQIRIVSLGLSFVMAIFTPTALVVGGFVVELGLPWQSVFWVSFALYAVLLVLALASSETPAASRYVGRLNWFASLGLGIWVTALLVGISEGPALGWSSPIVVGSFGVSAVTLTVWSIQQRRSPDPLMSFRNMDRRQAIIGYSGIFLISVVGVSIFVALPAMLQTPTSSGYGHGLSALDSTYVLLAIIPGSALGYLWTRWGLNRLGPKIVLVISGTASIGVFLGFTVANGPVWMSWVWVFGYALATLSCLTTGYSLVAAAGRQDNMAVTIGMQSIIQYVSGTIPTAIVLNVLVPGAGGFVPKETFDGIFIGAALVVVVFVLIWAVLAPKRLTDRHAIDTESDPTKVRIASHS
ncbi:MFS transporter [Paenarthrobacter sp. RAF54_2]|uniref:MFS transporter n=1 Tax=Paenarthrobacter sp. RAF54_2 TaxID=3233061 RepID=UPI003F9655EA